MSDIEDLSYGTEIEDEDEYNSLDGELEDVPDEFLPVLAPDIPIQQPLGPFEMPEPSEDLIRSKVLTRGFHQRLLSNTIRYVGEQGLRLQLLNGFKNNKVDHYLEAIELSDGLHSYDRWYVDPSIHHRFVADGLLWVPFTKAIDKEKKEFTNSRTVSEALRQRLFSEGFEDVCFAGAGVEELEEEKKKKNLPILKIKEYASMSNRRTFYVIGDYEIMSEHEEVLGNPIPHCGDPGVYKASFNDRIAFIEKSIKVQGYSSTRSRRPYFESDSQTHDQYVRSTGEPCGHCGLVGHWMATCESICNFCGAYVYKDCHKYKCCQKLDYFKNKHEYFAKLGKFEPGELTPISRDHGCHVINFTKYAKANKLYFDIYMQLNKWTEWNPINGVTLYRTPMYEVDDQDTRDEDYSSGRKEVTFEKKMMYKVHFNFNPEHQEKQTVDYLLSLCGKGQLVEFAEDSQGNNKVRCEIKDSKVFAGAGSDRISGIKIELMRQQDKRNRGKDWNVVTIPEYNRNVVNSYKRQYPIYFRMVMNENYVSRVIYNQEVALRQLGFLSDTNDRALNIFVVPDDRRYNILQWKLPEKHLKKLLRGDKVKPVAGAGVEFDQEKKEELRKELNEGEYLFDDYQFETMLQMSDEGIHCIVGAPGTGKTNTLVNFAVAKATKGIQTLIVAPTNVLADKIALDVIARLEKNMDRLPPLTADAKRSNRSLIANNKHKMYMMRMYSPSVDLRHKELRNCETNYLYLDNVMIIIATHGFASSHRCFGQKWKWMPTHILFDESSMLNLKDFLSVLYKGSDAKGGGNIYFCKNVGALVKSIVIAGDNQQLPPTAVTRELLKIAEENDIKHVTVDFGKCDVVDVEMSTEDRIMKMIKEEFKQPLQSLALTNLPVRAIRMLNTCYRADKDLFAFQIQKFYPHVHYVQNAKHTQPFLRALGNKYSSSVHLVNVRGGNPLPVLAARLKLKGNLYSQPESLLLRNHVSKMLKQGVQPHQILVLTPYEDQLKVLTDCFATASTSDDRFEKIRILTVDGAQGSEANYVFLSIAKHDGGLGFLENKTDKITLKTFNGRLCTALSRMDTGLIVYLDIGKIYNHEDQTQFLIHFVHHCEKHNLVVEEEF